MRNFSIFNISGHVLRLRLRRPAGVRRRQLHVLGRPREEEEEGEETSRKRRKRKFDPHRVNNCTGNCQWISRLIPVLFHYFPNWLFPIFDLKEILAVYAGRNISSNESLSIYLVEKVITVIIMVFLEVVKSKHCFPVMFHFLFKCSI